MKRKTRYFFIIFGLVVFLIIGPAIVLFVSGINYDFSGKRYVETGIISIKTDPSDAEIFLDDKKVDSSPANIRFLAPKEYTVTLKKEGYFDWSKRIDIKSGKAAILAGALDKIFLIKDNGGADILGNDVIDYALTNNNITFLTPSSIVVAQGNNYEKKTVFNLPNTYDNISIDTYKGQYALLSSLNKITLLRLADQELIDVTATLNGSANATIIDNGIILYIKNGQLNAYDPRNNRSSIVLKQINTFKLIDSLLYYVQSIDNKLTLQVSALSISKVAVSLNSTQTLIISDISAADVSDLYVTSNKDIALLRGDTLYRVNKQLETIAAGVISTYFEPINRTLAYTTGGEFRLYDFNGNRSSLITRSGQNITLPLVVNKIGYALFVQNNSLHAVELDTQDKQNDYALSQLSDPKKITTSLDATQIIVLDGTILKLLTVR